MFNYIFLALMGLCTAFMIFAAVMPALVLILEPAENLGQILFFCFGSLVGCLETHRFGKATHIIWTDIQRRKRPYAALGLN